MQRRQFLKFVTAGLGAYCARSNAQSLEPFDFTKARGRYLDRLATVRKSGALPILDIESSYDPLQIDLESFTRSMDRAGVALMCLSTDQPGKLVKQGEIWSHHGLESYYKYPSHFIPAGNGGNHPAWTQSAEGFLHENEKFIAEHRYPLMGEYEIRHYPSPRQVQRGDYFRDVSIPIDGPLGHRLFAFAEKTGIPFQIHYEIEDALLGPLEAMLKQYPNARLIWCHFAQIRYQARSTRYSPALLNEWLERFPNLYVDTAFGDSRSVYPPSGERHARYWDQMREWQEVIAAKPYRFLAALDIGGDRMNRVGEWALGLRGFLNTLPDHVREIVAYKASWKLLFNEVL